MSEQEGTAEETTEVVEEQVNAAETQEEMVSKSELKKVLDELHRYKKEAKEAQSQIKESKLMSLKEKEEWQKIAELKEQEAQEASEKAERIQNSYVNEKKFSAIKEAAIKAGIRKDAIGDLDLLDFEDVQIETTSTGRMNVLGAESAVKKLKMQKPHWFGKSVGHLNTDEPSGDGASSAGGITYKKLQELEKQAKATGNYDAYRKAVLDVKAHGLQRQGGLANG